MKKLILCFSFSIICIFSYKIIKVSLLKPIEKTSDFDKNISHYSAIDTIPFRVGKDHRIHLTGKVNNSENLDFLFDTGANAIVITSSLIGEKVNIEIDGTSENTGSDGISTIPTSSRNKMEVGHTVWNNIFIVVIDYQKPSFDGVIGWNAFKNDIVEIDYNNKNFIVHPSLPDISSEYSKLEMRIMHGVPFIKTSIIANGEEIENWFEFDTGSNWTLALSQEISKKYNSINNLEFIRNMYSVGSTGVKYKSKVVQLQKIKLGKFEVNEIPISVNEQASKGVKFDGILGNLLLKRFNVIIDFQNDFIYLNPNHLINLPY